MAYVEPLVPIEVLFIAESPPANRENFFYNPEAIDSRFSQRLFQLLRLSGLKPAESIGQFTARGYYLADVINCGWNKDKACVRQPSATEKENVLNNCIGYLETQVRYLRPKAVVLMGNLAQRAGKDKKILDVLREVDVPGYRIVEMPFILTAPVKTEILVEKLWVLSGMGRSLADKG